MNDEQRDALVEELADAMYTEDAMRDAHRIPFMPWDAEAGPRMDEVRQEFRRQAYVCLPIIDRLLTDRAASVPSFQRITPRGVVSDTERREIAEELAHRISTAAEPDADSVERVAKAMADADDWMVGRDTKWDDISKVLKDCYRDLARAAIAAMPSADADWLDDALDSVHPKAILGRMFELRAGGWEASVTVPDGPDENGWYDYTGNDVKGEGTTRREAILDACAKAKEAQ